MILNSLPLIIKKVFDTIKVILNLYRPNHIIYGLFSK